MVFSLGDVVTICSAILTIAGVITIFVKLYKTATQPEKDLAKRVERLERKTDDYDEYFKRDDTRFNDLEEGNRITQKGMLALLKHTKNGNDLESIDKAERDLEEYLINKK